MWLAASLSICSATWAGYAVVGRLGPWPPESTSHQWRLRRPEGWAAEFGDRRAVHLSNVYDLTQVLEGRFDIVFASWGVICWFPI